MVSLEPYKKNKKSSEGLLSDARKRAEAGIAGKDHTRRKLLQIVRDQKVRQFRLMLERQQQRKLQKWRVFIPELVLVIVDVSHLVLLVY